MVGLVLGGVVIGGAALSFVVARVRLYRRLLSDDHFLEIARAAPALKEAALQHADDTDDEKPFSPPDPRVLVTSARLLVFYSIRKRHGEVVHHVSVSILGGVTTGAVGMTFVVWLAMLVGLPLDRVRLEIARSTVHHGEATLTPSEQEAAAEARAPDVTEANVAGFRKSCLEMRSQLGIAVDPPRGHWR